MKKIYTGKEFIEDIIEYEGIMVDMPGVDNLLALELYSNLFEKAPDNTNVVELKKSIDEYLFHYTIPLIDYSDHVNKDIIILDETNQLDIKIIDSFNYNHDDYNKLKNCHLVQNSDGEREIQKLYTKNIINKCFDIIQGRDTVVQMCVIDFHFKSVIRMKRD